MPGAVHIRGDGVTLRTLEEDDLPFLRDTINDPDVREYIGSRPPLNLAAERDYFESQVSDPDGDPQWLVCADGDPVGTVGVTGIEDSGTGSCEVGLFLAPDHWGQGYGTEASRLATAYAFDERRQHRVVARVVDGNDASRRIWEKLGFRHEATFREADFLDGRYVDVHYYAVLEDEWTD